MAEYFNKLSGINPLTIDQTKFNEHSGGAFEWPLYKEFTKSKVFDASQIAIFEDSTYHDKTGVDITIIHPRTKYTNGRPCFYSINNTRLRVDLHKYILHSGDWVEAFYANERGNRIPADLIEIHTPNFLPSLYLFPGSYDILIRNKDSKILKAFKIILK